MALSSSIVYVTLPCGCFPCKKIVTQTSFNSETMIQHSSALYVSKHQILSSSLWMQWYIWIQHPGTRNPGRLAKWGRGHDGKTIVAIDQRFLADFEFVAVCSAWVLIVSSDGHFLVFATVFRQTFCQGSSIFVVSIQITWGLKNVMPKCIANQGTLSYRLIKCHKPIEPWGFSSHIRGEWAASRFPYSPATLIMGEAIASRHELRWGFRWEVFRWFSKGYVIINYKKCTCTILWKLYKLCFVMWELVHWWGMVEEYG